MNAPADQHVRDFFMAMQIPVSHVARPEEKRIVQQCAVTVAGGLQLIEEVRQTLNMVAIDLRPIFHALRRSAVMRGCVIGSRDTAFRITPHADIVRIHQRRYTRDVRLKRKRLKIPHQIDVLAK